MKQYAPIPAAERLGDVTGDYTEEEIDAIVGLFSNWFQTFIGGRMKAEEEYRAKRKLKPPTISQTYDLVRHKARKTDFPKVCFDYPRGIYRNLENKYSRQLRELYGDDDSEPIRRHIRLDIGEEISAETWTETEGGEGEEARHRSVQATDRQAASRPHTAGGGGVPRFRGHRHNTSLRKVDQSVVYHRKKACYD